MLSKQQTERAQKFLQGALETHIKDELKCMLENDDEDFFYSLCEEDFFIDISTKVRDASVLISWSSLLSALAKLDYEAFRAFDDYHLVDGIDSDHYKRIIEIHSMIDDTNSLFHDSLINAAQAVAGFDNYRNPDVLDFLEEGIRITYYPC